MHYLVRFKHVEGEQSTPVSMQYEPDLDAVTSIEIELMGYGYERAEVLHFNVIPARVLDEGERDVHA